MKRVYVCSPLSAPTQAGIQANIRRAVALCYAAVLDDVAPFAPHVFYTAFLDDTDPNEREMGLHCGEAWLMSAEELWAFTRAGITNGMQAEIAFAKSAGIPVVMDPPAFKGVDT